MGLRNVADNRRVILRITSWYVVTMVLWDDVEPDCEESSHIGTNIGSTEELMSRLINFERRYVWYAFLLADDLHKALAFAKHHLSLLGNPLWEGFLLLHQEQDVHHVVDYVNRRHHDATRSGD